MNIKFAAKAETKLKVPVVKKAAAIDEIKLAIDYLINTCREQGVCVAGFVWGSNPTMIFNFGNCIGADKADLYARLAGIADERRAKGAVVKLKPVKAS